MADQIVQVAPDSTGKKIQTFENTISGNLVEAQAVVLVDIAGTPITPSGSFFENDTARVDPSGNDSTGVVGDILKPFLTVQGAIDAIEAGSFTAPVIRLSNNTSGEDVTTTLPSIAFVGEVQNAGMNSLSVTGADSEILLYSVFIPGAISIDSSSSATVDLYRNSAIYDGVTNIAGPLFIEVWDTGTLGGASGCPGFNLSIRGANSPINTDLNIDSAGSAVSLKSCLVKNIIAADVLTLQDSRVTGTNNAVGTVYADKILNKTPIAGGTTGQVLTKASNADWDMVWSASAGGGISFAMAAGLATVL